MHRLGLLAATLLAALIAAQPAPAASDDAVPGELLVLFKSSAGGSERAEAHRAARVSVVRDLRLKGAQLLETEPGQPVERAVAALSRRGSVAAAAPNWIARATLSPDDTHYGTGSLWGLHNFGQPASAILGLDDADIDAPEAWTLQKDASGVVVAVVDTGVRYDHPDLDGNIWSNPGETVNGTDDADPGAKVDDVRGWDFVDGDNDPTDLAEHGTHVAGTIGAEGNNGIGVTGVAWDPQIMPVRVLGEDGVGSGAGILDGLDYAADMGARVVNASLGGPGDASTGDFYAAVMNQHPGTLYVVSAGNGGADGIGDDNEADAQYPCNTPVANLVCVAATNNRDQLAGFSNYGTTSVDLGAPGVAIDSTYPKVSATGFTEDFEGDLTGWTTSGTGGGWDTFVFTKEPKPHPDAFLRQVPTAGYGFEDGENLIIAPVAAYDLTARKGCVLGFDLFYELDEGKDRLLVEVSTGGGGWVERDGFTGTNKFVKRQFTNLHADGQPAVRFRFRTVADTTAGAKASWFGSLIDNVRVTCQEAPDLTSYGYMQGTSMASPHVAGVAALLFGARPDADAGLVRNWLLSSGDPIAALSGKTVSGRRLNANTALLAATGALPGPQAITDPAEAITETGATLKGRIDPNGTETTYRFLYGTSPAALTSSAPAVPASAGAGNAPVVVSQAISGLTPGQTYHFKLVAIQGGVETPGSPQQFTTAEKLPPALTIDPATDIGTTVATVAGSVNPNGKATGVLLEWGTATGVYTSQTSTLDVGDGTDPIEVGVDLTGLTPNRKYFYRLRASNADGSATSAEQSFTTLALPGSGTGTGGATGATTPAPATTPITTPVSPVTPAGPPAPPASAPVSIACRRTKARKVACKAGATAAVNVKVQVMRGTKVVARGSAASLTRGRALRIRTLRRVAKGRYKLRITVLQDGAVVTTLTRSIRL
jgi:subtilisin family serine protease